MTFFPFTAIHHILPNKSLHGPSSGDFQVFLLRQPLDMSWSILHRLLVFVDVNSPIPRLFISDSGFQGDFNRHGLPQIA